MLEIKELRFQYPTADGSTLSGLNLSVEPGTFLAVVGPSGSGKSTFLRTLNGLVPHFHGGQFGGSVRIDSIDTRQSNTADLSRVVGYAGQAPEAQTIFDSVIDEVAFGPENLGFDEGELRARIPLALNTLGIDHLRDRDTSTLSGGERQRVVIAATLAMGAKVLVLDEPLSQLDPWGSADLLKTLRYLNQEHGTTIIVAEHRIDRLLEYCTHVLDFPENAVSAGLMPIREALHRLASPPVLVQLAAACSWPELPLTVEEARDLKIRSGTELPEPPRRISRREQPLIRVERLSVRTGSHRAIRDISMDFNAGSVTALMGANGSGKSTLLRSIAGLLPVENGSITLEGRPVSQIHASDRSRLIGYVPQYPSALFLGQSIHEEIEIALNRSDSADIDAILGKFNLAKLAGRYSWDISGGEQQRLALAIATANSPPILLLDEPTRGMDQSANQALQLLSSELRESGAAVIMATHDSELVASCADRAVLLDNGEIRKSGAPDEVLSSDPALETDTSRVFDSHYMAVRDVLRALGERHETTWVHSSR